MNGLRSRHEDRPFMVRRARPGKLTTNGLEALVAVCTNRVLSMYLIQLMKKLFLESLSTGERPALKP